MVTSHVSLSTHYVGVNPWYDTDACLTPGTLLRVKCCESVLWPSVPIL